MFSSLRSQSPQKDMMWKSRCFCLGIAVLMLAVPGRGQQPSTGESGGGGEVGFEDSVLKQAVDEVSLDIVVHNKKDKPVMDLTREDLAIADEGTLVKISDLHLVKAESKSDHLFTFVFDNFGGPSGKSVEDAALHVLKALPEKTDSFAVMDFTNRLRLIHGFTNDRSVLAQAINQVTVKTPEDRQKVAQDAEKNLITVARTGLGANGSHVDIRERARFETLLNAVVDTQHIRDDQHAPVNLAGLMAIAQSQQKLSERRTIFYFTFNRQFDSNARKSMRDVVGVANRAGVSIFVVDMDALNMGGDYQFDNAHLNGGQAFNPAPQPVEGSGGMATVTPTRQASGSSSGSTSYVGTMSDWTRMTVNPLEDAHNPMAQMARDTGGMYLDAQANMNKALHEMQQDMNTYYHASYLPPPQAYDGKFRNIVLHSDRPGLKFLTRSGYYSLAPGADGAVRPFEAALLKALTMEKLPADLKVQAQVLRFGELPDGNTSSLAISVPLSEMGLKEDKQTGLYSARLNVLAQIRDSKGVMIEHFAEDIPRRGALDALDRDKLLKVTMQRHFMLSPGNYTLETAVKDVTSGKVTAQRTPFQIDAEPAGPSLSDLVLVNKIEGIREGDDPLEPLRYETGKITPNVSGEVAAGTKALSMFLILHPDAAAKEVPRLQMRITRNGKEGKPMELPLPTRLSGASQATPYMANLQGATLLPGAYTIKATMTQGGKSIDREVSFTIPGNATEEAEVASNGDLKLQGNGSDLHSAGLLSITVPTNPVPPPTAEEQRVMMADAREHAVHYMDTLPNFICAEVTNRSYDTSGMGQWKHRDTIVEQLTFRDKQESHQMMMVDGKQSTVDRDALSKQKGSSFSAGEFGGVLRAVFDPVVGTNFAWKETDQLGGGTVQVFDYTSPITHSMFSVTGYDNREVNVAYHGKVYVDGATHTVRRISLIADNLPKDFMTHSSSITVDYDYIVINAHDYLMPVSAELSLTQGKHMAVLNAIEFRDYHRFATTIKMLGSLGESK